MNNCTDACGTACETTAPAEVKTPGFTRRSLLRTAAIGLAALGMSSIASTAMAASKKITVCKTTAIKVGGANIFSPKGGVPVLITHPKAGVFRAFSPYCTHQRVPLAGISGTNLVCNQHGARFNTDTGKVTGGPAPTGLPKYTVTVSGTSVIVTF
jgi:nitrite reductase/ring-hydroxylating ferredoxin subunit